MPDWDVLYEIAASQAGYFTARQAGEAGYSTALLSHYVRTGQDQRIRHGIYRLVKYPTTDHEDHVIAWLWTDRAGVLSHETALAAHGLSDVIATRVHLTVPTAWRRRRLRAPADVALHHADLAARDRAWFGSVPITSIRRTLEDCARDHVRPDLVVQAIEEAVHRGLVGLDELDAARAMLATHASGR